MYQLLHRHLERCLVICYFKHAHCTNFVSMLVMSLRLSCKDRPLRNIATRHLLSHMRPSVSPPSHTAMTHLVRFAHMLSSSTTRRKTEIDITSSRSTEQPPTELQQARVHLAEEKTTTDYVLLGNCTPQRLPTRVVSSCTKLFPVSGLALVNSAATWCRMPDQNATRRIRGSKRPNSVAVSPA